jgi:subtilisin family serine protease
MKTLAARTLGGGVVLVALTLAGTRSGSTPTRGDVVGAAVYSAVHAAGRARVIVALREPDVSANAMDRRVAQVGALTDQVLAGLTPSEFQLTNRWKAISALAGDVTGEGLARLAADPDVLKIDLDVAGSAGTAESVPLIRADDVQNLGVTGRGVVVAVLDTGADLSHPDLKDAIADQACFCTRGDGSGCCPNGASSQGGPGAGQDDQGHGTNVAGIIAGRGRVARKGVAPEASLVILKVLDNTGAFASTTQVVSGFDYILTNRPDVKVVNMSLGTSLLFSGPCDNEQSFTMAFAQAINSLRARGTITFASSLNNGSPSQIGLPACIQAAVAVGAVYDANIGTVSFGCTDPTTAADRVACFSNSNASVDLLAPGAAITAAGLGGGISTFLGTSQASPHAAGVAALLFSAKPTLSPDQIETALKSTGVNVVDPKNGLAFKRIDARAALDLAKTF